MTDDDDRTGGAAAESLDLLRGQMEIHDRIHAVREIGLRDGCTAVGPCPMHDRDATRRPIDRPTGTMIGTALSANSGSVRSASITSCTVDSRPSVVR